METYHLINKPSLTAFLNPAAQAGGFGEAAEGNRYRNGTAARTMRELRSGAQRASKRSACLMQKLKLHGLMITTTSLKKNEVKQK